MAVGKLAIGNLAIGNQAVRKQAVGNLAVLRAAASSRLAPLVALGALAVAPALGCENTAGDCEALGTRCTGGGGTGGTTTPTTGGGGAGGTTTGGGGAGAGGGTGGTGGATTTSTPCPETSVYYGDAADQSARTVAQTSAGDVVIGGSFFGKLQFGVTQLQASSPGPSAFVARFDPLLGFTSAARLDGQYHAGALAEDGSLVVVGTHAAMVAPYPGCAAAPQAAGLFVIKLASDGACTWSRSFAAQEATEARVAVGPDGEVVVAGGFTGDITFASTTHMSAGQEDVFVVKLDASGNPVWSSSYGDLQNDRAGAVTVSAGGRVTLAGEFQGTLDLFDGKAPLDSGGAVAAFAFSLAGATGAVSWRQAFAVTGGPQHVTAAAVDTSDAAKPALVLAGDLTGNAKLGTGAGALDLTAAPGLYVARLDLASGAPLSGKAFPGQGTLAAVAAVAGGRLALTGWFGGDLVLGDGAEGTLSASGEKLFLAVLDGSLALQTARVIGGDAGGNRGHGVVFDGAHALLAGHFSGAADIGGQALTSHGGTDMFVARLCTR